MRLLALQTRDAKMLGLLSANLTWPVFPSDRGAKVEIIDMDAATDSERKALASKLEEVTDEMRAKRLYKLR